MRYWALVGLSTAVKANAPEGTDRPHRDCDGERSSPVNRITAARVMCQWGGQGRGVPVLLKALDRGHPSLRLHAALALDALPRDIFAHIFQRSSRLPPQLLNTRSACWHT